MMWYFLSTHRHTVKKTNKMCKKKWYKWNEKGKPEGSRYTLHQDMKQSMSVVIMNYEKTWYLCVSRYFSSIFPEKPQK
jgi:hypothetical protein